ncbi:MAG: SRPBCC domain-containing protein, partial [Bacteroidia bacterium]|nr:SRPBCC domain-containing protein [Bacteroidia bacterium]
RTFELSVEELFLAYTDAELVEQWMGTKVLKLESKKHGSYSFETTDPMGNKHGFNGVIHDYVMYEKITRTFEMENTSFPVQLEYLNFVKLGVESSQLSIHIIYKSIEDRDNMLKLPFAFGINMAHNRLQEIFKK